MRRRPQDRRWAAPAHQTADSRPETSGAPADRPSDHHRFVYRTKRWVLDRDEALAVIRHERDRRIAASDWVLLDDVPLS